MIKHILSILLLLVSSPAIAANTSVQFGVDRTVNPWNICVYDSTPTCQTVFSLNSTTGVVNLLNMQANSLHIDTTNPLATAYLSDQALVDLHAHYDGTTNSSTWGDQNGVQISLTADWGAYSYNAVNQNKSTFKALAVLSNMQASGQRFAITAEQHCYGMGDCFLGNSWITFAGANMGGDEGTGLSNFNRVHQQETLQQTTISYNSGANPIDGINLTPTLCNTTTTQAITGATAVQAVSVASTTNCNIGDWVVVDQEIPSASPNEEAVKITAVGGGKITGQFLNNHLISKSVTPARLLGNAFNYQFGQDRVLVNLSQPAYTTGTVTNIVGGGFTGTGTTWAAGMVGGTAPVYGCIALTADDYSGPPFNGSGTSGTLKSWYQILGPVTSTSLGIFRTDPYGGGAYLGRGPISGSGNPASAYTIRPCARVLRIIDATTLVLETNSFTWNVGDTVEEAISPYPTVSGHIIDLAVYTPGGEYGSFMTLLNSGARTFQYGFAVSTVGTTQITQPGADGVTFGNAFYADVNGISFTSSRASVAAIKLGDNTTIPSATILFDGLKWFHDPITTHGIQMQMIGSGSNNGWLEAISGQSTGETETLRWRGQLQIFDASGGAAPYLRIGPVNGNPATLDLKTGTSDIRIYNGGTNNFPNMPNYDKQFQFCINLAGGTTCPLQIDGDGVYYMANATTDPSTAPSTPSGGGFLYVYGGALKYRGSSGTTTTLAVP